MPDLDQGGVSRNWVKTYFGPTVGWVMIQASSILEVTSAGTTNVPAGTTLVTVNVAGSVTLQLATSIPSPTPPLQPTAIAGSPLTIVDIGGHATATPITILPAGAQLIMGQASIQITNDYGSFALVPLEAGGWGQQ